MTPIDSSRYYPGGGLGEHAIAWRCPACAAENLGPLEQGCASCGSGKPGYRPGVATPPPPRALRFDEPDLPPPAAADVRLPPDEADRWAAAHAHASLADAYRAGCAATLLALERAHTPPVTATPVAKPYPLRLQRTLGAALTYFRDQVYADLLAEDATDWLTPDELDRFLAHVTSEEFTHA